MIEFSVVLLMQDEVIFIYGCNYIFLNIISCGYIKLIKCTQFYLLKKIKQLFYLKFTNKLKIKNI